MFFCNQCGIIRFLTRPENRNPPDGPMQVLFCNFCQAETTYRKVLPEYFDAAHEKGVETMMKALYKKLTTPLSESDDITLDFLEDNDDEEADD